jgi:hypothetical protein
VTPQFTQEQLIQQTRDERARVGARASILFQVYQDLQKCHKLLEEAGAEPSVLTLKHIAEALGLFIKTQLGQAEVNLRELKETLEKIDAALTLADSRIARPTHTHVERKR